MTPDQTKCEIGEVKRYYVSDETNKLTTKVTSHGWHRVFVLAEDYDALRTSLAKAEADARRYRWLRDRFGTMGVDMGGQHAWIFRFRGNFRGPTLDAAIDAALSSKEGV